MSSCSASVRSFDDESVSTLLPSEKADEFDGDEIEIQKAQAYEAWSQQNVQHSRPLLSSCSGLYRCIILLSELLRYLLPSFIHSTTPTDQIKSTKLHPTAYLDGMRGMAAFAVFLCHLSYGTWDITHTYGSGAPGENNWLIQLPIVRLFYSGPPMVAIFFVISGYALSFKPVRLMRAHQYEALMTSTSSSIFRRALRLYLPCFASTFMVVCLAQVGVFALTEEFANNARAIKEHHVHAAPSISDQLSGWFSSMSNFINIFDWSLFAGTTHFDPHLWTIPVEYRCSLLLFLTHMLTARMPTRLRIMTIVFLLWWGAHWDRWDMIPFWAGQILAELHHIKSAKEASEPVALPFGIGKPFSCLSQHFSLHQVVFYTSFVLGCYLASFPDLDGHQSPGYVYLNSIVPEYWSQKHRFWPNIGAIIIVWSVGNLEKLKRLFSSGFVQYMGRISFPLYVMHGPIINTFGYMVSRHRDTYLSIVLTASQTMEWIYAIIGTEERWRLEVGFFLAALLTITAVVWAADIFLRTIDTPCVRFSKWFEEKLFVS